MAFSRFEELEHLAAGASMRSGPGYGPREAVAAFRETYKAQFAAAVDERANGLVKELLNGPRTHKYKGVAVTEEQFWQFMATEGFHKPEADPIA